MTTDRDAADAAKAVDRDWDRTIAGLNAYWEETFGLPPYPRKGKKINDPLYKTIWVEPPIRYLVDLPLFQRLRYVNHLGLTYFVFPTANHKRFDHSLGVYRVVSGILDFFERSKNETFSNQESLHDFPEGHPTPAEVLTVKIAALLHDVGHLPFSHCSEQCFVGEPKPAEFNTAQYPTSSVHEYFSCKLLETPYVHAALAQVADHEHVEIDHELLKRCVVGDAVNVPPHQRYLVQLVHANLDADKIDYLVRDSHFTGVPYGTIDLSRLTLMFRVKREAPGSDSLVLYGNERGLTAFESLLVARLFMFSAVYHHHAKIAAESRFTWLVRANFAAHDRPLCELLTLTDHELIALLEADPAFATPVKRLFHRRLPKIVHRIEFLKLARDARVPHIGNALRVEMERDLAELLRREGYLTAAPNPGDLIVYFSKEKTATARFQVFREDRPPADLEHLSDIINPRTRLQRVGFVFVDPRLLQAGSLGDLSPTIERYVATKLAR